MQSVRINVFRGLAALILLPTLLCASEDPPARAPVDFTREVWPILQRSCLECHGPDRQEAELRLDQRESALQPGEYAAIQPGDPDASELVRRISLPRGHDEIMPSLGEPLTAAEIKLIRDWINQGADWPESIGADQHWAYVRPERPEVPAVNQTDWPRNPIDSFILARLERERLSPSAEADRATLIRRLSLDLIGLPPTPAEVDAYVNDTSPDADENLVDRMLASEQFGVRWARPWLDYAHYADSHGFQRDDFRDLWPYRDWVVNALNADMPFDRFTIEQLAGDLLPDATEAQRIATGFGRCSPCNVEAGSEPEETRVNQVFDRVNTVGMVWLGTTLECCQCHDHKYDPFTMRDYYSLFAFFNNTQIEAERADPMTPGSIKFRGPEMELADPPKQAARDKLNDQLANVNERLSEREEQLSAHDPEWEASLREKLTAESDEAESEKEELEKEEEDEKSADLIAALETPVDERSEEQAQALLERRQQEDELWQEITQEKEGLESNLKEIEIPTTLVMVERDEPRASTMFVRGDYRSPGDPITPATPAVLTSAESASESGTRLDLARWLVSPDNPLTPRVVVNRWWAELFGHGLVTTPEDFGVKGDRPTHPELLDWLAVEFVDHGWSMKHVLKTIVMSATYRQSSHVTSELLARDDGNRLYARGPRFRMDAEMIRDNALAIAGLLSPKIGGPPIRPWQPDGVWIKVGGQRYDYIVSPGEDQYRRGLYVVWKRGAPYPSFINFDANNRLACRVKRPRSNTPLQALTLMNDPVYVEAAMAFARRVVTESPSASAESRITHAFRVALSRGPKEEEATTLMQLYDEQLAAAQADKESTQEFLGDSALPEGVTPEEFVAWYAVAATLLNLDETITKG